MGTCSVQVLFLLAVLWKEVSNGISHCTCAMMHSDHSDCLQSQDKGLNCIMVGSPLKRRENIFYFIYGRRMSWKRKQKLKMRASVHWTDWKGISHLRLRRPWGFSHEARRGPQGASRAAPGNSQEKEMQKSKMALWGGLTNSCEKKESEKQRRKGKIYLFECRVLKNSKER